MKYVPVLILFVFSTLLIHSQESFKFQIVSNHYATGCPAYVFDGKTLTYKSMAMGFDSTIFSKDLSDIEIENLYQTFDEIADKGFDTLYSNPSTGSVLTFTFHDEDTIITTVLRDYYNRSFDDFFHAIYACFPDSISTFGYPKELILLSDTNYIYLPVFSLKQEFDSVKYSDGLLSLNKPEDYLPPFNISIDSVDNISFSVTSKRKKSKSITLWYAEKSDSIWVFNQYDFKEKKYIESKYIVNQPSNIVKEEVKIMLGYFPSVRVYRYYGVQLVE